MPLPLRDEFGAQLLHRIRHFADSPLERRDNRLSALPSINGRERFRTSLRARHDDLPARNRRASQQPIQPLAGKVRQIASQNKIPIRPARIERARDSREWPPPFASFISNAELLIVDYLQSESCVRLGRTDSRYARNQQLDRAGDSKNERLPAKLEKPLCFAHARTGTAGEYKSRNLVVAFRNLRGSSVHSVLRLCIWTVPKSRDNCGPLYQHLNSFLHNCPLLCWG